MRVPGLERRLHAERHAGAGTGQTPGRRNEDPDRTSHEKTLRDLGYTEDTAGPGALRQRMTDEIKLVKATAQSAGA